VNLPFKSTILIHTKVPNVTKCNKLNEFFFYYDMFIILACLLVVPERKLFLKYFLYTKLSNQITSMRKNVCSIDFFYLQLDCGLTYWSITQIIYSCVITLLIMGTKHKLWRPKWLHCLHVVSVGWIGITSVHLQVHDGWQECDIKSTKCHLQEAWLPLSMTLLLLTMLQIVSSFPIYFYF
jgi:hypothetical protein